MTPALERLRAAGVLSALDHRFAESIARLSGETRSEVVLAAALASRHVAHGHVCLDVAQQAEEGLPESLAERGARWPEVSGWLDALRSSPLVELHAGGIETPLRADEATPLVLDAGGRLYLRRYFAYQQALARSLVERATRAPIDVDESLLAQGLEASFPSAAAGADADAPDWQRRAADCAVRRHLCVISGGPGTGKTSTVAKILWLCAGQALAAGQPPPRALLLAPTGKAAAHLRRGVVARAMHDDGHGRSSSGVPDHALTIHRALGLGGVSSREARPLPALSRADIVVVDEASMVDLSLMARLVGAVRADARLILLGDRDQLASVEAGAVLGDICNVGGTHRDGPLADAVVQLTRSHRYGEDSGIGALARAINAGDADAALSLLADPDRDDVQLVLPGAVDDGDAVLDREVVAGYGDFRAADDPVAKLRALDRYRVLAAHRHGPAGVDGLNARIERALARAGGLAPTPGPYPGRPLLITRNDYELGVWNGDVGIVARHPAAGLRALFLGDDGEARWHSPLRLQDAETAFAISIHKSQGSEFDAVSIVLPDVASKVVTRELLYTAVSRARQRVRIHATPEVLVAAIGRRIERASGLREALWGA